MMDGMGLVHIGLDPGGGWMSRQDWVGLAAGNKRTRWNLASRPVDFF